MTTPHDKGEYERLKTELRRLKRKGAPWYFESALHQRLHIGRGRIQRFTIFEPLPVALISVLALCTIALAIYAVMINSSLFSGGGSPVMRSTVVAADSLVPGTMPAAQGSTAASPSSGAATRQPMPATPRKAVELVSPQSEPVPRARSAGVLPLTDSTARRSSHATTGETQAARRPVGIVPDTVVERKRTDSTFRSVDSLGLRADSAKVVPPGAPRK